MSGSNHRRQQSSGTLSAEPDEPTQNDEEPEMGDVPVLDLPQRGGLPGGAR